MMWGYRGWPMMWGWGILMWLVPLGLLALIFWAVSRSGHRYERHFANGQRGSAGAGDPALDIIRQRLAKGEITEEEYDKLKERLLK